MRILFLVTKGKADALPDGRLEEIRTALGGSHGVELSIADSPAELAARIVEQSGRFDCVAVGGGDGTLSTAASALKHTQLPLLIIPLGTANDLARTLGVPLDPVAAAGLVRDGRHVDIDVGEVNGHFFFNAAGIGLSVDVAERLAKTRKRFGPLSYLAASIDILRARRSFGARITCDGNEVFLRSIQVTVGNGRRHGGGVIVHSTASVDDGRFDIYSLGPRSIWKLLLLFPSLIRGTHHVWRNVTTLHGRSVVIETPDKPKRVNADGEIVTHTPATFTMHRNAVVVIVPKESARVESTRLTADTLDQPQEAPTESTR